MSSQAPSRPGPFPAVEIGPLVVWPPVVLAPMAGVTNVPFRTLCKRFGAGLYVSEMLGARAIVEEDPRTLELAAFGTDEPVRSIQLYATEPESVAAAAGRLAQRGVQHIDLNFGCPAPKVTRHGGGAALPFRSLLFGSIVQAAVEAAGPVPVTVKMRMGIDERTPTYLTAGRIAEEAGAAAVALHARTAEQLYSGKADWTAIGRLVEEVSIPVLGNGDIWEASDAVEMMWTTGCHGVVVGRGCLGRPWLFRELADVFAGRPPSRPPDLGRVAATMVEHAELLAEWFGVDRGIRSFRKHTSWYLKGFVAGRDVRRALNLVESVAEVRMLVDQLDLTQAFPREAARMRRGHTHGPRPVKLPHRYLEDPRSKARLPMAAAAAVSGG